jgi:hypothetical protein
MAVRLDPWQNIVGVGWGGSIQSLLLVNMSLADGIGASLVLGVGKATVDELAAQGLTFSASSGLPFYEFKRSLTGYGLTVWTRSNSVSFTPPAGAYRAAMNLEFAQELAAPVITFRTSAFYGYADATEEQGATETGSMSFVYFGGVVPLVMDELTTVDGVGDGNTFLRYDQSFASTATGTRTWSHGPGDAANRGDFGDQRAFFINYTINALTGEVGDPFFTSTLDG